MVNKINRILIVVQPSANHYREPFLRELMDSADLSLELFGRYNKCGHTQNSVLPLRASEQMLDKVHRIEAKKLWGPLTWDRGLFRKVLCTNPDLYVLEGNVYNLTTWLLTIILKIRGRKVVFWGHGWKRPESGLKLAIRKFFYRLPNAHFVYGNWAKNYAASVGLPSKIFYPIYNSYTSEKRLRESLGGEAQGDYHLAPKRGLTLLFSGRLTPRHGVDQVLKAVLESRRQKKTEVKLLVVGDGPEYSRLLEMTEGDPGAAEFLGAVYSMDELRRIYARADYAVSPGASGLNVIQALSFRVPVIAACGDSESGPEIEAIRHRKTGLLYPAQDIEALKKLILEASSDTAAQDRECYIRQGSALLMRYYTAEQHASAFHNASLEVISGANDD